MKKLLTEEDFLNTMKKILCLRKEESISMDDSIYSFRGEWDSLAAVEYLDMIESSLGYEIEADKKRLSDIDTVGGLWEYYQEFLKENS